MFWTYDGPIYWRIYASWGSVELTEEMRDNIVTSRRYILWIYIEVLMCDSLVYLLQKTAIHMIIIQKWQIFNKMYNDSLQKHLLLL